MESIVRLSTVSMLKKYLYATSESTGSYSVHQNNIGACMAILSVRYRLQTIVKVFFLFD